MLGRVFVHSFGAGGEYCFQLCPSVSESVRPRNLVSSIAQKPMKSISPNFDCKCTWVRRFAN